MCKYTNNLYISKYIFILFLFFTKYGKYINLIYRYLYLFLQLCIFKYSFFHNYVYLKMQYILIKYVTIISLYLFFCALVWIASLRSQ